jgi:hypothetical protein
MRRRTLLVALAGLAVVGAGAAVMLLRREDRVTRQNFDRITEGMSRTEVESILGSPGDYRSGPVKWKAGPREVIFQIDSPAHDRWIGDHGTIDIWFPEYQGYTGARHMTFHDVERIALTPLDNLVWRAKRQWHRWFPE